MYCSFDNKVLSVIPIMTMMIVNLWSAPNIHWKTMLMAHTGAAILPTQDRSRKESRKQVAGSMNYSYYFIISDVYNMGHSPKLCISFVT